MSALPPVAANALIDAAGLASLGGEPRLLLFDCRFDLAQPDWGLLQFRAGHIPDALYADLNRDLSAPVTASSGRHPLPHAEAFAARLGSWGYTPERRIVCYDQGHGAYAARLWWLLRAWGHADVRVLDGGYASWLAAGLEVETSVRTPGATSVPVRAFSGNLGTEQVAAQLPAGTIRLVDARSADRFAGHNETIDTVAGHVPGALNRPFTGNLGSDGRFLPAPELQRRWRPVLEGRSPDQLVMMCGSGVTACHNLLALEVAGIAGARLYAGSFSEWIRDPQRPVATGADAP